MHRFRNVLFLLSGLLICGSDATVKAEDFDLDSLQNTVLQTIEQVRPAVVNITARGSGFSGVIVSPQGHVLSAAHAVTPGATYRLTLPDGRRFRGVGKGSNNRADCALIMITDADDDLPFAPMGDSSSLVTNQPCIGVSFPGGQKSGTEPIARFGRVVRNSQSRGMLQSSALMEPGDSGGPLFDLNGYVIGIHSRIGRPMDRNYEVPVDIYRRFWNELNREQEFTQSGPPVPVLGVRIPRSGRADRPGRPGDQDDDEEKPGLLISGVVDDSRAAKGGVEVNDRLLSVYDRQMQSLDDLRAALIAARDEGVETIMAKVQRDEETLEIEMDFDVEREAAPEVGLPDVDHPKTPAEGYREMRLLADQLKDLESRLDDACVEITSQLGEEGETAVVGTRILGTPWVVSKSSRIGNDPVFGPQDERVALTVVQRDSANDLILLRAPEKQTLGVDLDSTVADLSMGTFLLTPDSRGRGMVSVAGSPTFRSARFRSRGFLGVVPATYQDNQGAILNEVSEGGAAKRAGLLVGDVVTRLNDTIIRSHRDMRNFLSQADPNAVITATLKRDEDELTKSITLGAMPTSSRHAADQMDKSVRRDGFERVLSHDADLDPEDCGGPLFDLEGRFVGLNIARNSRIRSYALTAAVLQKFVKSAADAAAAPSQNGETDDADSADDSSDDTAPAEDRPSDIDGD